MTRVQAPTPPPAAPRSPQLAAVSRDRRQPVFIPSHPEAASPPEVFMARITVEDCQERVNNRFLLVQMAIKRVHQYREGYPPLVESRNKEVVTALREIAAAKIMPEDLSYYVAPTEPIDASKID
jgi:DNA-directed RNA polymerase subunit omega